MIWKLALEILPLEVEGTDAEGDLDIQTKEEFALMDTAMALSDTYFTLYYKLVSTRADCSYYIGVWQGIRRACMYA